MKIFLTCVCMALSFLAFSQGSSQPDNEKHLELINAFLNDVASAEKRSDVILAQYVALSDSLNGAMYDYLEASIDEIRLNLSTKNKNEIEYIPFHRLPRKETRDIDPEGKSTENMYFLKYKGRQMLAIYIADDKIASFTLVSKGNKIAHFVTY